MSGQARPPGPRSGGGRARAPRPVLSREGILAAALERVDRLGLEGLTIRALADDLGVTPMALYRHVRNKAELVDGLLDRVVGEFEPTRHGDRDETWPAWLRTTFRSVRRALIDHPGVMPLLGTTSSLGPNTLRVMEETLTVLRDAGFDDAGAARAFFALVSYTVGAASIEATARRQYAVGPDAGDEEWLGKVRHLFASLPGPISPPIVGLAPQLAAFPTEAQFDYGLAHLIGGLEAEVEAASP